MAISVKDYLQLFQGVSSNATKSRQNDRGQNNCSEAFNYFAPNYFAFGKGPE
jgi:hypothetical protein